MIHRGELTAVNVVSPSTLAGIQQQPEETKALGMRNGSSGDESIQISLKEMQQVDTRQLNESSEDKK